jgi:Fur family ferric uptake transcriptional regulator
MLDYLERNRERTVSAGDILAYMTEQNCPVNKTTIYRYLDKLTADNILMKYVADKGEKSGYQLVGNDSGCHEHLHLQCTKCGRVIHMNCEFMEEITKHIEEHHGFKLSCGNSILYGLCDKCCS